jgi:uncharacterized membrane protein AbrB (regulator of aidB expression)
MVAGGASGVVSIADELGADGRLVAFMQYMRVLVVVVVGPLVAYSFLHSGSHVSEMATVSDPGVITSSAFTSS